MTQGISNYPVHIKYDRFNYKDDFLIKLYKELLKPRLFEEKMLILLRQGKITKWFSGIGQEAIAVGATLALEPEDYIFPMHRNLGVFTSRDIDLKRLFAQFQGKLSGFTNGRDRSFHFGYKLKRIVGMISHLGPQLSLADGVALANQLMKNKDIVLAFSGDGGTSEGEFHEALNVAAVWHLPVIFLVENNGYGLSTPNSEQFHCEQLAHKGIGYGMEAVRINGNNIIEVYDTINHYADDLRYDPRPVLIEAMTFRMRGHEEASGTKYVPEHLMMEWGRKDPVQNFENYLLQNRIIGEDFVESAKDNLKKEINEAIDQAFEEEMPTQISIEKELSAIYVPLDGKVSFEKNQNNTLVERRLVDAIADGLWQSMEKFDNLVLMGQDIAEYGGVFKVTQGFLERFGSERVRNTPLCESAIIGVGLGLSIKGYKSVVEMQFADFVTCGFNQIINNLAKIHYRWGQEADVVVRMPTGAGVAAGPFHSQSNEAWFFHTPGLKVVYPSTPFDAKGLLMSAIEDPNPVLFFEHKFLYRSILDKIPEEAYTLEIGKARLVAEGTKASVITYGLAVHWVQEIVKTLGLEGQVDIVDLRSLLPWDKETVAESVQKTGRVLVCHEDCLTGGIGGEISAWIAEHCFIYLDAPVMRAGSLDTPVPFSPNLEQQFLPKERIKVQLEKLLRF